MTRRPINLPVAHTYEYVWASNWANISSPWAIRNVNRAVSCELRVKAKASPTLPVPIFGFKTFDTRTQNLIWEWDDESGVLAKPNPERTLSGAYD